MEVSQESILSLLIAEGGKVKNSDLMAKFKGSLNCDDPAEKKRNRDLFKSFVNNVATVKEIDGARYVVIKKRYQHLLNDTRNEERREGKNENEGLARPGGRSPAQSEEEAAAAGKGEDAGGESPVSDRAPGQTAGISGGNVQATPPQSPSPIQLALQRSKFEVKLRRSLNFQTVRSSDTDRDRSSGDAAWCMPKTNTPSVHSKPYALPLRMPPSATRVEFHKLKGDPDDVPAAESPNPDAFRSKRLPWSGESSGGSLSSPQLRRAVKTTKPSEEPAREPRGTSTVPLEQSEHEWLVKLAAGHWSQVYGLLLRDSQLAEKRDFMSGFTALHWAAKSGNSEMLEKIIEISKHGGADIDVNAKTHGGYTPLHIAALHDQEFILSLLVDVYGADASIRDNCGKRAYHYLHKGISERVRGMLGEPRVQQDSGQHEKEELDLFPDLSKSLHTISRLFQPHVTGHKKKHKQRPGLYSQGDDSRDDGGDSGSKHRALSDVFM